MAEARAAEVFDGSRVDPIVLAEDEATGELRLALRHPLPQRRLGSGADLPGVGKGQGQHNGDADQDEQRRRATPHRAQGWSRARSDSIVAGPIPLTSSSCSTEARPPCWSRYSTMSCAVTGPMPSIVSSCSTVALPRPIGPLAAAGPAAAAPAASRRHHDLLSVGEAGGAVDRLQHRPRRGAAGALHRVDDPRSGRHPVDAGPPHRAGDVDDDVATTALDAEVLTAPGRGGDPGPRGPGAAVDPDRAGAHEQQGDGDGAVDDQLGAAQLGHRPSFRLSGSRVARSLETIRLQVFVVVVVAGDLGELVL